MVSCKFSLKPIHWFNGSEDLAWFGNPSHWKAWREVLQQLVPGLADGRILKQWGYKTPFLTPMDWYPSLKMCIIHVLTLTYTSFLHIWMCMAQISWPLLNHEKGVVQHSRKTSSRNWSKRNSTIYRKIYSVYHKSMGKHCKIFPPKARFSSSGKSPSLLGQ